MHRVRTGGATDHRYHPYHAQAGQESDGAAGDSSIITPAPAPEGEEDISDHYQINETSSALLTGTADAGDAYQEQTHFIGDSNTVRLYANGLISLQQFCAKEGIGTSAALNEGIVTFKRDDNRYTIAQAVAKMSPAGWSLCWAPTTTA